MTEFYGFRFTNVTRFFTILVIMSGILTKQLEHLGTLFLLVEEVEELILDNIYFKKIRD